VAAPVTTTQPQRVAPSAANGVSLTPSGTAWANSTYGEVIASTGSAIIVLGVIVNPGVAAEFEMDIAKGASGSEVVVARVCGNAETLAESSSWFSPINIPIDNIAASQRVAIRMRKSGTSTTAWTAKLLYINQDTGLGVTANVPAVTPSAAAGVSVTPNGTAWANSTYGQLSASLTDIVCLGVAVNPGGTITTGGDEFEIDIATGAAGAEVVKGTLAGQWETFAGTLFLRFPITLQLAGTNRVAIRMRKTGTATTAWTFKLLYVSTAGFGTAAIESTAKPQKSFPAAADMVGATGSATAWANSPWTQLVASSAAALVLGDPIVDTPAAAEYEIDIGKGAAGSEVVVTTSGDNRETALGIPHLMPAEVLVDNIPASTRVAYRFRDSDTTANVWDGGVHYYERPL
jgi:hypothetical protein